LWSRVASGVCGSDPSRGFIEVPHRVEGTISHRHARLGGWVDWLDMREEWKRPEVKKQPWMEEKVLLMVNDEAGFKKIIDDCIAAKVYALDLETEGLDNRVYDERTTHQIVGGCFSPDGHHGYYVPIRHREHPQSCLPITVWEREMKRLVESDAVAIFHNGSFDHEFLQFCGTALGEWDDPKSFEDSQILAYLSYSRLKQMGLKPLSKKVLNMEMIELKELFDPAEIKKSGLDFGTLDPTWEPVTWYGAADAICTYLLYKHFYPLITEGKGEFGWPESVPGKPMLWPKPHGGTQKTIYAVEKLTVPATRWMQRNRIPIDRDKVAELIAISHREWLEAFNDVYEKINEALGRDVRPGKVRLLTDPSAGEWFFNPDEPSPTTTERLSMCGIEAEKRDMDPTFIDEKRKKRIRSIEKVVPKVTDPKLTETIQCPLVYDIASNDQLGLLFRELAVPGLTLTEKSQQVVTRADELDRVVEETGEKFTFMGSIKRWRNVHKALSNLYPIYLDSDPRDNTLWVQFKQLGTDTGRYTTPGRKKGKKQGGTSWNLHSTPATYDPSRPEGMRRIREVIRAREGRKIVAIDFAGVELRIVTNMSREPEWLNEFFRCSSCGKTFDRGDGKTTPQAPPPRCPNCGSDKIGDLHTLTAISVFGSEVTAAPDFKQKRQQAKGSNFALCYGGGGQAVMRSTGCSKAEGWRIKNLFDKKYKGLARWWGSMVAFAKKHGYVMTAMGRWYPQPDIDHPNGFFSSKAERNSVNGPVQGGSADITKLAMAMIYREMKKLGWLEKVRMIITIHDELVFEIDDDILGDAIETLVRVMTIDAVHRLRWPVPLTVDCEIGFNWTVPWDYNEMRYGEVRFIGDKKYKKPSQIPEGYVWEEMQSFPDALKNLFSEEQRTPPVAITGDGRMMGEMATRTSASEFQKPEVIDAIAQAAAEHGIAMPDRPAPVSEKVDKGEVFTHSVFQGNLSMQWVMDITVVIQRCEGRGTNPLRIVVRETGDVLYEDPNVLVDAAMFSQIAFFQGV